MIQVISEDTRAFLSESHKISGVGKGVEEGDVLPAEEAVDFILKMTRDVTG